MRKILFWLLIILLAFLAVVLVISAQRKESPKVLLQSWFTRTETTTISTGETINDMIPITTSGNNDATSGELSEEDRNQTQNLIDSIIE